ncbi:uncharacterized protein LOC116607138 [Nematostella vectensis]|uniref:uncharacterized protein LOC116607138 n=1 Tax=Nematostella vectensis TaxID=45351 RepID=UPI002076FF6F|nr:uncharacterized protein LOC116607138 [Nematostella vectensis]
MIRKSNLRCSCPMHDKQQPSNKQPIPSRFYPVFDEIGLTVAGYQPGTRWCYRCKLLAYKKFESRPQTSRKPVEEKANSSTSAIGTEQQLQKIFQFTGSPILHLHESMQDISMSAPTISQLDQTKQQFGRLFSRLEALADICDIHLLETWKELQTPLGTIKIAPNGNVLMDSQVWDQIKTTIKELDELDEGNSLGQLVQQFQMALYHHALSSEAPLYEPAAMKAFTQKHSPGLFEMLLSSITREDSRLSDEHQAVQEQRTVVLLHTLAYFRSQKASTLQKDEGLFLQHHGASRTAINPGRILGFSTSPRNIDSHKKALITKYPDILTRKVILATEKGFLIVQLLDDFHNILTVRLPTNLKLSLATHMASGLLDIHPSIPAVPIPTRDTKHSQVIVTIGNKNKICREGIVLDYIKELFQRPVLSRMYLETNHQCISPKYIQQQLKELRVYSGFSHDELCTLESTNLIDEFEQSLKIMEDYKSAIDHIFLCCPQLEHYLKKIVVPAPWDWPTWFYQKKLIAQEVNADASFLSVIPEQGPFHVFLNLQEDVLCKDIEYASILFLLDEVVPISFFHYPVTFRFHKKQMQEGSLKET